MIFNGNAIKYGDNVDTDVIIPARYLNTIDKKELASHCMEDLDKTFITRVKAGDIMVAGNNFGCGSSREHAPIAIKESGISLVIANSFARIFYRNSINIGLAILECPEAVAGISEGDTVEADLDNGVIYNRTTGAEFKTKPFPEFVQKIITAGGLVESIKQGIIK
ncbi:MAG: 3-isopropylmalate dehydratase small subunit [Clostridia bacterium]|nr:3-isopropylmalate dehydratase small subunit [Clostridia bacterium]